MKLNVSPSGLGSTAAAAWDAGLKCQNEARLEALEQGHWSGEKLGVWARSAPRAHFRACLSRQM